MRFHFSEVTSLRTNSTNRLLITAAVLTLGAASLQAQCLTNPSDVVGNPVFGATVATFTGIDPNVTCIENGLWSNPVNFGLGNYVKGADALGGTPNPTVLGYDGSTVNGTFAGNANALDFFWVQDNGNQMTFSNGVVGGRPSQGIIWDLGGAANKAVVFVQVDHGPVPQEVLENTAWLSNDPNAADGDWTQAFLTHVYGAGWSPDPNISDGFVAVYTLPSNATFRYVSVTWGGPGAIHRDGDNEIDAVGGLKADDKGVHDTVPEPSTYASLGGGLALMLVGLRRRKK